MLENVKILPSDLLSRSIGTDMIPLCGLPAQNVFGELNFYLLTAAAYSRSLTFTLCTRFCDIKKSSLH